MKFYSYSKTLDPSLLAVLFKTINFAHHIEKRNKFFLSAFKMDELCMSTETFLLGLWKQTFKRVTK